MKNAAQAHELCDFYEYPIRRSIVKLRSGIQNGLDTCDLYKFAVLKIGKEKMEIGQSETALLHVQLFFRWR
jgi:hypothetical protein